MFSLIFATQFATRLTARKIITLQAQTIVLYTVNVRDGRTRRSGTQQLKDLRKHYANIVGVGSVNVPDLGSAVNSADPEPLEHLKVKVFAIEDRAEIVTEPTIITALFIASVPMRTTRLTADTAQAPITRARYFICDHGFPSPLLLIVHFAS